jgi:hypothetical protein
VGKWEQQKNFQTRKLYILNLGQFFVNLKPLRPEHLATLGFKTKTILDHNSLTMKLAALIGEGKTFNAVPTPVKVKSDHTKPLPGHLISNIKDYFASCIKGSSKTRLIFVKANPNTIPIDLDKWKAKVQSTNISINQVTKCLKNLTCKYISNDYLDYKSRSIHGRTQFNSNLAHHKQNVQKWCNHCLNMGIRTPEDFAHSV